jgi:hypothetical protein
MDTSLIRSLPPNWPPTGWLVHFMSLRAVEKSPKQPIDPQVERFTIAMMIEGYESLYDEMLGRS